MLLPEVAGGTGVAADDLNRFKSCSALNHAAAREGHLGTESVWAEETPPPGLGLKTMMLSGPSAAWDWQAAWAVSPWKT